MEDKMIVLDGINCYVLIDSIINDKRYIYVAEIEDEDITENFYLYRVLEKDKYEKVTNMEELKAVLPSVIALCQTKMDNE